MVAPPSRWTRVWDWLVKAGWLIKETWEWASIYEAHRKAGHADPRYAAEQEIFLRGEYLERFRDMASDAYILDGTDLDQVKKDFIKDRLMTKTTMLDTQTTASVRAVIRDMPMHEAYHPWVLEKYHADTDRYLKGIMTEAEQAHGKGGYTDLERRVLRGRG